MHWFELYLVTLSQLIVTLALLKRGLWTLEIIVNLQVLLFTLMSRNARDNENGRFDKILSNQANVHVFDDFVEF